MYVYKYSSLANLKGTEPDCPVTIKAAQKTQNGEKSGLLHRCYLLSEHIATDSTGRKKTTRRMLNSNTTDGII